MVYIPTQLKCSSDDHLESYTVLCNWLVRHFGKTCFFRYQGYWIRNWCI